MLQLNAQQLAPALSAMISLDKPLMIWASPGVGKSDIIRQLADDRDAQLVDIRLSMWDSVDVRGVPSVTKGVTCWNPPAILPFEGNPAFDSKRPIFLFLDELTQALPAVQAVAFQLILDRAMGEHKLMPNVRVFAASNRQTDRAGANRMATPLANRMTHVELIPNLDAWCSWAFAHDKNPLPIAFLRLRPDLLNTFDPSKGDVAFATPRSWETVCDIVGQNLTPDVRYALTAGTIGEGPATELEAFVRTWERMPNIDGILMNPAGADVPSEPDILYAVSAALAARAEKANFGAIIEYVQRLPDEFAMMAIRDSVKRKPEVQATKAFSQAAVKYSKVWRD